MNIEKFARIAESLRQYRRAELKDFDAELGGAAVDSLYVDPLPNDAILRSVVSGSTTFLVGRKGTGKSTVFARAQNEMRSRDDLLSIYIDVKTLYDTLPNVEFEAKVDDAQTIDIEVLRAHLLRKKFLGQALAQILAEVEKESESLSITERWLGKKRSLDELKANIEKLRFRLESVALNQEELPTLTKITRKIRSRDQSETKATESSNARAEVNVSPTGASATGKAELSMTDFERSLVDSEVYDEYSNVVMRSLPFVEIMSEIRDFLTECKQKRLVIFFDDYSELGLIDQRLFVDVVLSPLNNSSHDAIKLKIAGYPGRVYYGRIDPSKVDIVSLDFSSLHEANEIQTMELAAISYTKRLLEKRFSEFSEDINSYIDTALTVNDFCRLIFQATFNVPRLMGLLLHTCFLDRVSKGDRITAASIRLAARKHYENVLVKYFERLNRYALEPFENKLDRHNQLELLKVVIYEAKRVRAGISDETVGGTYFKEITNPPVSHFIVSPELEPAFRSLEANFIVSKYKSTRDKNGKPVTVVALFMGLTESERLAWGYPPGRQFRNYFVQRCFDYSDAIHEFMESTQTIRCSTCGTCFPLSQKASIELYKWSCPECREGVCSLVQISGDFADEVSKYKESDRLERIELEILGILHNESKEMLAGEISRLIDTTYQLVGRRTSKLNDLGLVQKERGSDDRNRSQITKRAENLYFGDAD